MLWTGCSSQGTPSISGALVGLTPLIVAPSTSPGLRCLHTTGLTACSCHMLLVRHALWPVYRDEMLQASPSAEQTCTQHRPAALIVVSQSQAARRAALPVGANRAQDPLQALLRMLAT